MSDNLKRDILGIVINAVHEDRISVRENTLCNSIAEATDTILNLVRGKFEEIRKKVIEVSMKPFLCEKDFDGILKLCNLSDPESEPKKDEELYSAIGRILIKEIDINTNDLPNAIRKSVGKIVRLIKEQEKK